MPAKRKVSAKRAAKGTTKNAEVALKVAELAMEQERERLRNEEFMLRQRLEEEEGKLLESHRVRETEVRNAISERERKVYYEAREKELMEKADLKEREVQELRATVAGLQQAQNFLESEKESTIRRIAMLNNELELAQMRHLEAEALAESNDRNYHELGRVLEERTETDQNAIAELRGECQILQKRLNEAEQQYKHLQERTRVVRPAGTTVLSSSPSAIDNGEEGASGDADIIDVDPRSVDAETTVLLKVLNGEVAKYKELAIQLQASLDGKDRDDEKSSLLVGILNTQLESVREENKRLFETAQSRLKEVQAVQTVLDEERARNKTLYEQFDRATSEAAVQQRQLQLEVNVHRKQVEELTQKLEEETKSHKFLQAEHKELASRSMNREQDDFQRNVSMHSELEKLKKDMSIVLKERQKVEDEAFNYKILSRAEIDSLKTRLQKFQETMEKNDRTSYETIAVLRADVDRLTAERTNVSTIYKEEKKRVISDLERMTEHRDSIQAQLEALTARAAATEKELYEKLVHMTACHDARAEEAERLRTRLQEKEEEYTNNAIYLNAEKENLQTKIDGLQEEAQRRRREHIEHINKITRELTELQTRLTREMGDMQSSHKAETDRADLGERNVKRLQQQIISLQEEARTAELGAEQKIKSLKADGREARSELAIAKRTIQRLEVAIGDQAGYVQLTELNGKLLKELEVSRKQVADLNSTVANMKMEEDIMGGYKLQMLGEENEKLRRRISQLERYQRLTMPLFAELRSIAERGNLPSDLIDALSKYDVQVSRMSRKDGAAAIGVAAASGGVPIGADGEAADAANSGMTSTLPAMLRPSPPAQRRQVYASVDKLPGNSSGAAVSTNHLPYIDV